LYSYCPHNFDNDYKYLTSMLKLVARSYLGYGIQKDMGVQVSLLVYLVTNLSIPYTTEPRRYKQLNIKSP
jgi:hypothetical protein